MVNQMHDAYFLQVPKEEGAEVDVIAEEFHLRQLKAEGVVVLHC